MIYDRALIGQRFRIIRQDLSFSQSYVSEQIDVEQGSLSAFENGTGSGMAVFIGLLNFYGKYHDVSNILSENFSLVERRNNKEKDFVEQKARILTELKELEDMMAAKLLNIKIITRGAHIDV